MTRLLLLLLAAAAVYAQLWYTPYLAPEDFVRIRNITVAGTTAKVFYPVIDMDLADIAAECRLYRYDAGLTRRVAEKVSRLLNGGADTAVVYAGVSYHGNPPIYCSLYRYLQLVWDPNRPPRWPVVLHVPKSGLLVGASAVGPSPDAMTTTKSTVSVCGVTHTGFIVPAGRWYVTPSSSVYLIDMSNCTAYALAVTTSDILNASPTRRVFAILHVPPQRGRLWVPIREPIGGSHPSSWKYYRDGGLVGLVADTPFESNCWSWAHFAPPSANKHICALYSTSSPPTPAVAWLPVYYNSSWGRGVMPAFLSFVSSTPSRLHPSVVIHPEANGVNRVWYYNVDAPFLLRIDADGFSAVALAPSNFSIFVHGRVYQFYTIAAVNYAGRKLVGKHAVCGPGNSYRNTMMVEATTIPAVTKIRNRSPSKIYAMSLGTDSQVIWVEEIPPDGEAYVVVTRSFYIAISNSTPCTYHYRVDSRYYGNKLAVWNGTHLIAVGSLTASDYELLTLWLEAINATFAKLAEMLQQISSVYSSLYGQSNATALTTLLTSPPGAPIPFYATNISTFSSVTIRTYVETLTKFSASAIQPAFAGGAPPPPPPAAAFAAAAAGALGVAWAASRRDDDVITAAAVAGVALALFSILFTLVHGAQGLSLAALGIIIAAAAAAYKLATR